MTLDHIRTLYAYDHWANARMLAAMRELPPDQLTRPLVSSFPSILATFAHLVGAEWVWLQRWRGISPANFPVWVTSPQLEDLAVTLAQVEAGREQFLADLTDADLDSTLDYHLLSGKAQSNRLADLLLHVVNHSTYHRGQLTTLLRQVGAPPPATDYVVFRRENS